MRYVIDSWQLPAKFPVSLTLVAYLTMDRLRSPLWVWWTVGVALLLLWWISVYAFCTQVSVRLPELEGVGDSDE